MNWIPRASIPEAFEDWPETKAAYRLLSNEARQHNYVADFLL